MSKKSKKKEAFHDWKMMLRRNLKRLKAVNDDIVIEPLADLLPLYRQIRIEAQTLLGGIEALEQSYICEVEQRTKNPILGRDNADDIHNLNNCIRVLKGIPKKKLPDSLELTKETKAVIAKLTKAINKELNE